MTELQAEKEVLKVAMKSEQSRMASGHLQAWEVARQVPQITSLPQQTFYMKNEEKSDWLRKKE